MPKHIVRLTVLLFCGLFFALVMKWAFTAPSFYQYGHYRGDAVAEMASRKVAYQGAASCRSCHSERLAQWSAGSHKSVNCETCHGAGAEHPAKAQLAIPEDSRKLCSLCHQKMAERPRAQPQIDLAQHGAAQQCVVCHDPHSPKLAGVVAAVRGDASAGHAKHAETCAGCHGEQGLSDNDAWPNLAGQNAAYIVHRLAAFKSGAQKDPMMSTMAQALGSADIQNLATYYGAASCAAPAKGRVTEEGKALAKNCAACHGEKGEGVNPAWPRLAGQKPGYLADALKAFRAGLRKDPTMSGIARSLSDADISSLASYYAAQSCSIPLARKLP